MADKNNTYQGETADINYLREFDVFVQGEMVNNLEVNKLNFG